MTRPTTFLVRMLVFLAAVLVVAGLLFHQLFIAFSNNPLLNSLILFVLLIGIFWNLRQVLRLTPEVNWLETFQQSRARLAALPAPRLLAPMASMLSSRTSKSRDGHDRLTLSSAATRSLLDSLASRLDESRELSRYMTGLLIFLGLLGTFWGLLLTVGAVADVINGMSVGSGDINALFEQLKSGLSRPLHGMGTAFSSSMFGLSGSLILGFLDLTAGQAQNRFFNELEEWLASLTRVSSGALGEGDAAIPVYVQALLEQTAENMEGLQRILSRGEEGRIQANQAVLQLTERLSVLSESLRGTQAAMARLAEPDDSSATKLLRAIDSSLQRLALELPAAQAQTTAELRQELRLLARTMAARAEP